MHWGLGVWVPSRNFGFAPIWMVGLKINPRFALRIECLGPKSIFWFCAGMDGRTKDQSAVRIGDCVCGVPSRYFGFARFWMVGLKINPRFAFEYLCELWADWGIV